MRPVSAISLLGLAWMAAFAATVRAQDDPNLIAPSEPLPPAEQQKKFHLQPGFDIELIVADPEIGQPTNIAFDASGRLWISSTLEYPYPASGQARDRLRYMVDTNQDGVPDAIHTFADGLNIPIGVASVKDGVLNYSIPNIYKFKDSDGDGKADVKEVAYSGFDYHRDTHGMASSFRPWIDGWVYACHGFANDSAVQGSDKNVVKMNSGNTYRFRPDGSHVEQWTWGQVNPFGLAFDPLGNLYSSDCHSKPAYQLLRGAYYPSFGKPHDGLGFGPELLEHLHGSTGIAGIVYYAADHLPKEFHDNLLIGNPVTGRINRDRLERHGSTYRAIEMPDFVSCDDRWFRPVDIAMAPDGSLYVADFYNCIIGHYEVRLDHPRRDREKGRIWRIVYKGTKEVPATPPKPAGDMTRLDADALIGKLADPNLQVRVLATNELVDRIGPSALGPARELLTRRKSTPEQRAHGLWVVERLAGLSDEDIETLSHDSDPVVQVHLMKALAERKDWPKAGLNIRSLVVARLAAEGDGFVKRAAADGLGRHPDRVNLLPLLEAWKKAPADDTHLIHVVRMALRDNLRELGDVSALAESLGGSPDVHSRFADVALGLQTGPGGEYVLAYLKSGRADRDRRGEFFQHAARYLPEEKLPELFSAARMLAYADDGTQMDVLRSFFNAMLARGKALPPDVADWAAELARRLIASKDADIAKVGLEFSRDLRLAGAIDRVRGIVLSASSPSTLRAAAMDAMHAIDPGGSAAVLVGVVRDESIHPDVRKPAAEFLGKTRSPEGVAALVDLLKVAPADFAVWLARGLSWSDQGGDELLKAIEQGKASAELLNDSVVSHELRFRAVPGKDRRLADLKKTIPSPDETLRKVMAERQRGFRSARVDVEKGKEIFQKNCGICHQIAGQGAKVGPQLDGIGVRGLERLLEDTLDPDRNVDQAFRKVTFLMLDGTVVAGLPLRKDGAVIVVADAQGKEVRIAEDKIDERQDSKLSPMPNDVAKTLPPKDFFDLMAFLLSQRQK